MYRADGWTTRRRGRESEDFRSAVFNGSDGRTVVATIRQRFPDSFNPVLTQFLTQGGAMDPQDLGGRGAIAPAFFEKGTENGGLGKL
jgi:hypothetical protein